jgi:ATP-binding cassette, subfamily B, bacterial MsbA
MRPARQNYLRPALWEIRTLFSLTADHKTGFALVVALGLAASFVETLSISLIVFLLYRAVLNTGFPATQGVLAVFSHWTERMVSGHLYMLGVAIGAAVLLRQAFVSAYDVVGARVGNDIYDRIRTGLFTQYLTVSYEYISAKNYGELTNALQVETWRVSQAIEQLSRILVNASAMLVYLLVLFLISWQVSLAGILGGLAVMGLTQMFRHQLRALSKEATRLHEDLAERMFTSIQAMRTIRTHGVERAETARFAALSRQVARVFVRLRAIDNASRPFLEIAALALIAVVVWVSNAVGNSGATTVTIVALLFRLQPQVREMQAHILALLSAEASLAVVVEGLDRANKPYPVSGSRRDVRFEHELAFHDVVFLHRGAARPSLDRVSFTITPGMTVGLVGPSGAGKTTIVNLLLKLYEPTEGLITMDGVSLAEMDREAWLKRIAITGQDIDLLEGSILDNVRLAHPRASIADVKAALKIAGVLDFVEQLPDGLDTQLGERAFRVSGGQRQRISLARAIVGRPDILILDEATNAVEPVLESSIHAALRSAFPQLTIIIVAHRNSALEDVELLITLDSGRASACQHIAVTAGSSTTC